MKRKRFLSSVAVIAVVGFFGGPQSFGENRSEYYRYDESGNIVEKRIGEQLAILKFSANRLVSQTESNGPDLRFEYSETGALTGKKDSKTGSDAAETVTYERGFDSRLTGVRRAGAETRVIYDHRRFPAGKIEDGRFEPWVWEGASRLVIGEMVKNSEMIVVDYLGTELRSETGLTLFGEGGTSLRFTGKDYDSSLGAYIFPYRAYFPGAMRWDAPDPAGFPGGKNQYAYVKDPARMYDALGLAPKIVATGGNSNQIDSTTTPPIGGQEKGSADFEAESGILGVLKIDCDYDVYFSKPTWASSTEVINGPDPKKLETSVIKFIHFLITSSGSIDYIAGSAADYYDMAYFNWNKKNISTGVIGATYQTNVLELAVGVDIQWTGSDSITCDYEVVGLHKTGTDGGTPDLASAVATVTGAGGGYNCLHYGSAIPQFTHIGTATFTEE